MKSQHIPGLSLAVIQGSDVTRSHGYGFASLELDVPVTPNTVFQIGSLTKQFTATAMIMLVEEGKIGLDNSVSDSQEGLPAAWRGVTVQHLLNHTIAPLFCSCMSVWQPPQKVTVRQRCLAATVLRQ